MGLWGDIGSFFGNMVTGGGGYWDSPPQGGGPSIVDQWGVPTFVGIGGGWEGGDWGQSDGPSGPNGGWGPDLGGIGIRIPGTGGGSGGGAKLPGSGSPTPSGSQVSILDKLLPSIIATGGALLASQLRNRGMDTSAIDKANAKRSADYQKNFVRVPLIRRGIASLPSGYNPITQSDTARLNTQFGGYSIPGYPAPMIPPAGTGGHYAGGGPVRPSLPKPVDIVAMARSMAPHEGMVAGPGAGMDDKIRARSGDQEIRLSDGEFVIPADVVSSIGDGSSNAGAQELYAMLERIRKKKYGRSKQPAKFSGGLLPG